MGAQAPGGAGARAGARMHAHSQAVLVGAPGCMPTARLFLLL